MISMRMLARGTALDFVTERIEHLDGISGQSVLFVLRLLRTLFDRLGICMTWLLGQLPCNSNIGSELERLVLNDCALVGRIIALRP